MSGIEWTPELRQQAAKAYADYLTATGQILAVTEPYTPAFVAFVCQQVEKAAVQTVEAVNVWLAQPTTQPPGAGDGDSTKGE